jgi:nicotinamidase-related amidase
MKEVYRLSIPETLEEVCDPQRVALLVYDMQVGILSQIANPHDVTCQVRKVLAAARDAGVRVFFRDICHCQKNSWACPSFGWGWRGNARILLET